MSHDPAALLALQYSKKRRRTGWALLGLALLAAGSFILCLGLGPLPIPAHVAWGVVLQRLGLPLGLTADPMTLTVVLDLRLARLVLAFGVGAALALAGTIFQGLLRNPLADPFTLGVASGAAFGASAAIALGWTSLAAPAGFLALGPLPFFALLGAGLALAAVLAVARTAGGLGRETLVLAGVVVASVLAAGVALCKALAEESVASIVFWIMGGLQGRGWGHVALLAPFFVAGVVLAALYSRELDLLALGRQQARLLGVQADRAAVALLLAASLLTAAAVAVAGVIGFVGLIAPHGARLLLGASHRPLLAAAALAGGSLTLWADALARTILPGGAELPVGVVTALLGGPFFCLLLARRATRAGRLAEAA